jgi:amidophosphoribosyltransferase
MDNNKLEMIKGKGLIYNLFSYDDLKKMNGGVFLGHTRYKTNNVINSFQPFYLKNEKLEISFCHNGNIINVDKIEIELNDKYKIKNNRKESDSFILFQLIFYYLNSEIRKSNTINISELNDYLCYIVEGSYSIIMHIKNFGLIILKDKNGIRPLVYGKNNNNDCLVSSESCSLINVIDYKIMREVEPGEIIYFKNNGEEETHKCALSLFTPCLFEYIYFSRLDSIVNNVSIYKCRFMLGELLGNKLLEKNLNIDFIIPTPETSRVYAYGISKVMGLPIQECIIKNRYINRTFIIEDKETIRENIKRKFSVISEIVKNKNVLLVDDSIVRGNTSRSIVRLLKNSGAKQVIFASAAPKIFNTNKFGIHIEQKEELITYKNTTNEKIAKSINCDSIHYNDLTEVMNTVHDLNNSINNMEISMFQN